MKIPLLSFFFLALTVNFASAQTPFDAQRALADTNINKPKPSILKVNAPPPPKRFGRAALEFGIAEMAPWIFDRYIVQVDWAKITWKTTKHNINPGNWRFDNDPFQTNQFGHPFHGSLFYNSFRSNGFTFWESAPAAVVGSYLWETFAETQAPAPNDFINTSFGGIVLGEMTHRLSNKIVNPRSRGFKRQVAEVFGFLINPMNGLTRITDGKWGKVSYNPADRDSSRVRAEFDLGVRRIEDPGQVLLKNGKFGWYGRVKLLYGTPFENYRTPFSNMYINVEMGRDDSSAVNAVNVYGSLAGWEIPSKIGAKHLAVLSANYDYLRNQSFFYGGQSVKINLISNYDVSKKVKLNTLLAAGPVLLGAVPDPYGYDGRTYDYTTGATFVAGGGIALAERLFASVEYRGGWLSTINGNQGSHILHTFSGEFRFAFNKSFSAVVEPGYLRLENNYKNFNDVDRKYPFLRATVRYGLNL
ncbi:DUF3943 domain-containing protein [Mucilaginibacter daejeonensis]|uniref:DUF3943 domain-containing protein n=1 Tax=Mucilaginibacter daejeonensis TaxID=398049 RepID=UPI001D17315A|nr:DUF3943 domain-containing protein [Mucilaginibacter daejeonensis]UEG51553.1 DUF3943 domain-containing protein [Mucilaginibacter daejeonensis]